MLKLLKPFIIASIIFYLVGSFIFYDFSWLIKLGELSNKERGMVILFFIGLVFFIDLYINEMNKPPQKLID